MSYIVEYYRTIYSNELYHHGILGMKWGVRRFQPYPKGHKGGKEVGKATKVKQRDSTPTKAEKLTSKTSKKFAKIDSKIDKRQKIVDKKYAKAEKKSYSLFATQRSINKAFGEATQAQKRVNRLEYQGSQYFQKKQRQFAKINVSMNSDLQKRGEEYLAAVRRNSSELYRTTIQNGFRNEASILRDKR